MLYNIINGLFSVTLQIFALAEKETKLERTEKENIYFLHCWLLKGLYRMSHSI